MVAVLLLERDDLLPPACRVLVFERMKLDRCAGKVLRALSIFKGMGLGNEVEEQEESECSTTVYALSTASEASASWEM